MGSRIFTCLVILGAIITCHINPCHAETMTLVIRNSDDQPIAGANAEIWITPQPKDWPKRNQTLTADAAGKITVRFEPGEQLKYVHIEYKTPGYAPFQAVWTFPKDTLPAEYVVQLDNGIGIGGIVADKDGNPIPDVEVDFRLPFVHRTRVPGDVAWTWARVKTDADGRWCCDFFPPEMANAEVNITFTSPDFKALEAEMPVSRFSADSQGQWNQTVTLEKGCPFSGRVLDESGRPIVGAIVSACETQDERSDFSSKTTNAQGEFQFQNLDATQDGVLIARADGFMTERVTPFVISQDMKPVDVILKPAQSPLKIQAVDENGKPLPDVNIYIQEWDGIRQYYTPYVLDERHRKTDADGMIVWDESPAAELKIDLRPEDERHFNLRGATVLSRDEEYVFTLQAARTIPTRVFDSQTRKPIPRFTMTYGDVGLPPVIEKNERGPGYHWMSHMTRDGIDGTYVYGSNSITGPIVLKAEAAGYRPMISRIIKQNEKDVSLEFAMEQLPEHLTKGPAGMIMTLDGSPMENATVVVSSGASVPLDNGVFNPEIFGVVQFPNTLTDREGRFELPATFDGDRDLALDMNLPPDQRKPVQDLAPPDYTLFVFHENGYARAAKEQFEKTSTLRLQPWAKVEGTVLLGSTPGSGQQISLRMDTEEDAASESPQRKPGIYYRYHTTSDENGGFHFDRVPQGKGTVMRIVRYSDMLSRDSDVFSATFESGKTTKVRLGGVGRSLVGKLEVSGDFGLTPIWRNGIVTVISDIGGEKDETRLRENQKTIRSGAIGRDGTFRVENVPSGRWELHVSLVRNTPTVYDQTIGELTMPVTVGDILGAQNDTPQDLGTLTLKRVLSEEEKLIKIGAEAPDFELKRLALAETDARKEGGTVKLSELRGKTVILEFWATWCGPCIRKIPEVAAFYEKIKDDPSFVLIGISLDEEDETAIEFLRKRDDMPWIQLRTDWPSPLTEALGFPGIPAMFVISPEGRISSINPSAEELETLHNENKGAAL